MPPEKRVGSEQVPVTSLRRQLNNPVGYSLCAEAEQNLADAANDWAVATINDEHGPLGLFKIRGRRLMLAVADRIDADGNVFERGSWYMPSERKDRDMLIAEMDNGATHIPAPDTQWILLRRAGGVIDGQQTGYTEQEILAVADNAIMHLPEQPQPRVRSGLLRRAYRQLFREGFNAGWFAM